MAGAEPLPSPLPGSAYGHSSDSTLGVGCVVSGLEPQLAPLPGSAHGHSSDSTLGMGCVVKGPKPGSTLQTEPSSKGNGDAPQPTADLENSQGEMGILHNAITSDLLCAVWTVYKTLPV